MGFKNIIVALLLFNFAVTYAKFPKFLNLTEDVTAAIQSLSKISNDKIFFQARRLIRKGSKHLSQKKWMEVPLDHFDVLEERTWNMRYFVFDHFYKKGGPLFIEVGGEWTISGSSFMSHPLSKLLVKYNGMMVETEHRYYGESLPFSTEYSAKNMKYLTYEQALEDLAYFIQKFKEEVPGLQSSKVVLHGGSYPGMLVTWMRLKYPHIVDVAYASSAPLGVGLEYTEFYEVSMDAYANVSDDCIETIRKGFEQTNTLLDYADGREMVKNALRNWNCGNVDEMSFDDIAHKYMEVLGIMDDPYHYEDIGCLAMAMNQADLEPYERLAKFITLKARDQNKCNENEQEEIEEGEEVEQEEKEKEEEQDNEEDEQVVFANMTDPEGRNSRSWDYQCCTQMGFATIRKNSTRNPFGIEINVQSFLDGCITDFGKEYTKAVVEEGTSRVIRRYGGVQPKVTKVVTLQGTHDPWKHLAHLGNLTDEAPVCVFDGSHCANMWADPDEDEELPKLRRTVDNIISKWLDQLL